MSYFIRVWEGRELKSAARERAEKAIAAIDPSADIVVYHEPGTDRVRTWLERPNDGTNDYNYVRARNAELAAAVETELEGK